VLTHNYMNLLIKINGLQYNPQRDPQAYRRCVNQPFRIEALIRGTGTARCSLRDAQGALLSEQAVALPGVYTHEFAYATPGTRIVTLTVETGEASSTCNLRLDVLERAWVG
jgi:hypothetical protein